MIPILYNPYKARSGNYDLPFSLSTNARASYLTRKGTITRDIKPFYESESRKCFVTRTKKIIIDLC